MNSSEHLSHTTVPGVAPAAAASDGRLSGRGLCKIRGLGTGFGFARAAPPPIGPLGSCVQALLCGEM